MIKSESNLIIEIWDLIRDSLPAARRHDIAVGIIKSFVDFGFEKGDFSDIIEEDDTLTAAYNEFFNEGDEDIDYGPDHDEDDWDRLV